jgi:hypothetical protein
MPLIQIRLLRALDEAKSEATPPSQTPDGVDVYIEHETGLEPATPTLARRCWG